MPNESATLPLDLSAWPSVLALPLRDYQRAPHPWLKLWLMCDVVELTLRLAAVVGVAELRAADDKLPAELRDSLAGHIHRPTTGQWKVILQEIVRALPRQSPITQDLKALFDALAKLLDAPSGQPRNVENSLSTLRNEGLAHGAGVSKELPKRWLDHWQLRFEAAMADQARTLTTWMLLCCTPDGLSALRGPSRRPNPISLPDGIIQAVRAELAATEHDAVVLVRASVVRRLWPLTLFGPPRTGTHSDDDLDAEPAAQLYSRKEATLQYTPIGCETLCRSVGTTSAAAAFDRLFKAPPIKGQVRGFEQDLRSEAAALIGRKAELQRIQQLIAQNRQGLLWMTGRPGIGKSFLMAKAAVEPLPEPAAEDAHQCDGTAMSKMLVLPFRFRIGDDRCSRDRFCQYALERLREWGGLRPPAAPTDDTEEARQRKALSLQLREALHRVNADDGWRVLLLLDGLDELLEHQQPKHRQDPNSVASFARELPVSCRELPGVLWLCAGRPEAALVRTFTEDVCTYVFPVADADADRNGVPPLDIADIRKILLTELDGPDCRRLLDKDFESADGQQIENQFIAKVAAYSSGLPLYVRLVVNEVKGRGTLRHFDPADLPKSLQKFYARLIEQSTVGVLQQITTPVVATLAVVREPLSPAALLAFLRDRNILEATVSDEQTRRQIEHVAQALAIVAPLLKVVSTPDGEIGYALSHHTLREFIRDSERCRAMHEPVATAYAAMLKSCTNAAVLSSAARMYLIRNAAAHLIEACDVPGGTADQPRLDEHRQQLETLLTELRFLEATNEAGLIFELVLNLAKALRVLPKDRPQRRVLRLLDEAVRRDIHFIHRHREHYPQGLFQCLWNSCWWYDCRDAASHYLPSSVCERGTEEALSVPPLALGEGRCTDREAAGAASLRPRQQTGPSLCALLERWRLQEEEAMPGFRWVRTLRPPPMRLGSAQLAILRGHEGEVRSVAFSPDGDRIVSESDDEVLRVWDARSGRELDVLGGRKSGEYRVSYDRQLDRLFAWSGGRTVRVWDPRTGAAFAVLRGHRKRVAGVVFSPDGTRIVSFSDDKTLRVWDARNGRELAILRGHSKRATNAVFSPDGERIVSLSDDNTMRLWDARSGAELTILRGHSKRATNAVFSPDGERIVSLSDDNTMRLWDARSGVELTVLRGHVGLAGIIAFSPDGARILAKSSDLTLRLWDACSGAQLAECRGHEGPVLSVAFSPDGNWIVSGAYDQSVRLWDARSGAQLAVLRGHDGPVLSVAFSPGAERIVSGSRDQTVRVWEPHNAAQLAVVRGHERDIVSLAISPAGEWIVSGSLDGTARMWDASSGEQLAVFIGHEGTVTSVTISRSRERIVSGSADGTVRVWDARTGAGLAVLRGHERGANSVAISSDEDRIASALDEGIVRVLDAGSGAELVVLRGHDGPVWSVDFSPDGDRIVSAGFDETVRVWDAHSGAELTVLRDDGKGAPSVAFSPAGDRIASGYLYQAVRVWDARNGECLEVLQGSGDLRAIAAGYPAFPLRALARGLETVVERADNGMPVVWFPVNPEVIVTYPSGRTWAGAAANYLCLITLEGGDVPT